MILLTKLIRRQLRIFMVSRQMCRSLQKPATSFSMNHVIRSKNMKSLILLLNIVTKFNKLFFKIGEHFKLHTLIATFIATESSYFCLNLLQWWLKTKILNVQRMKLVKYHKGEKITIHHLSFLFPNFSKTMIATEVIAETHRLCVTNEIQMTRNI